jgi:hypothetical protein
MAFFFFSDARLSLWVGISVAFLWHFCGISVALQNAKNNILA